MTVLTEPVPASLLFSVLAFAAIRFGVDVATVAPPPRANNPDDRVRVASVGATLCCAQFTKSASAGPARTRETKIDPRLLDIKISNRECVVFDELAARLDLITHEDAEQLVGGHRIVDFDL